MPSTKHIEGVQLNVQLNEWIYFQTHGDLSMGTAVPKCRLHYNMHLALTSVYTTHSHQRGYIHLISNIPPLWDLHEPSRCHQEQNKAVSENNALTTTL